MQLAGTDGMLRGNENLNPWTSKDILPPFGVADAFHTPAKYAAHGMAIDGDASFEDNACVLPGHECW